MSEQVVESDAGTVEDAPAEKPEIDWKSKAREWEKRAKENSSAAARLAEIEESQKSVQQKLEERASAAERVAQERERELLRMRVAVTKQLPGDLADRLRGDSEDELSQDADRLLELFKAGARVRTDVGQGPRSTGAPELDMSNLIRRGFRG